MITEDRFENISSNMFSDHFPSYQPQGAQNVMAANSFMGKNEFRVNLTSVSSLLELSISNKTLLPSHAGGVLTRNRIVLLSKS